LPENSLIGQSAWKPYSALIFWFFFIEEKRTDISNKMQFLGMFDTINTAMFALHARQVPS
jgi:hypothetical protein